MTLRPLAKYRNDTRRTLRGHSADYITQYIGRHILHILVADELLKTKFDVDVLTPEMRYALTQLEFLGKDRK